MSTLNLVKFYFLPGVRKELSPTQLRQYMALAYQTADDLKMYPSAVLIRSGVHATTWINGRYQRDPNGKHIIICFKDQKQVDARRHVASHGYVKDDHDTRVRKATHSKEKSDSVRVASGREVWPSDAVLEVEIAFGHYLDA